MPLAIGALIGGLAGAGIGFAVSGLTAVSLGWAIGSLIGQMLFAPSNDQVFSGPRLENTNPAVSNIIGSPIQFAYGTVRIPGNIIWSNKITEVTIVDKQESGGSSGGGSSSTTITYEYFLDFAVAICEGPITGIKKIWASNKLIYNQDGSPQAETWLDFTIYTGSETQEADPYMRSIQIANGDISSNDASPAYRGLSYIVFKQFDLKDFGNRAPYNIDFEVVASGNSTYPSTVIWNYTGGWSQIYQQNAVTVVSGGEIPYIYYGLSGNTDGWCVRVNPYDYNDITVYPTPNSMRLPSFYNTPGDTYQNILLSSHTLLGVNAQGDLVSWYKNVTENDGNGDTWIAIMDGDKNEVKTRYYAGAHDYGSFLYFNWQNALLFQKYFTQLEAEAGYQYWKFIDCSYDYLSDTSFKWFEVNVTDSQVDITGSITGYRIKTRRTDNGGAYDLGCPIMTGPQTYSDTAIWWSSKEDTIYPGEDEDYSTLIYKFTDNDFYDIDYDTHDAKLQVTPWFYLDVPDYPAANPNPPCGTSQLKYSSLEAFHGIGTIIEQSNGHWVLTKTVTTAGASPGYFVWCFVPTDATKPSEWYESPDATSFGLKLTQGLHGWYDKVENSYMFYDQYYSAGGGGKFTKFNFSKKEWIYYAVSPLPDFSGLDAIVKTAFNKYLTLGISNDTGDPYKIHEINLNQVNSTDPTLSSIVTDLCDRANLPSAQRNFTDISDIYVKGFAVRERETARKSIEDVTYPYFVDPVVSDWVLKYVKRGPNALTTIPTSDLGCIEGEGYVEPYTLTYPDENTLPKELDFRYLSRLNNYQTAHQRAAKHSLSTNSEDKATLSTFVVLDEGYAKEAATKFLKNMWVNAKRLSIKLPKKYSYLEPTDLIQIFTKSQIPIIARIVEIFNNYNILEVNAELEYYDLYESLDYSDFAANFDTSNVQQIPMLAQMLVIPIDSYPLYDIILDGSQAIESEAYIYLAASSNFSSWPGGAVHFSENDTDFTIGPRITDRANFGTMDSGASTIKLDIEDYRVMDVESSIIINWAIEPTDVSTITKEEALAGGKNTFWINNNSGGEIITAQTVSKNGSEYTLTNILRGRYGTNKRMASYGASAVYEVVNLNSAVLPGQMQYGIYDTTYYYKGVTTGANYNLIASDSKLYQAKWNDTIPPVNITTENVSGDLVIDWELVSKFNSTNMFGNVDANAKINLNCRLEILNTANTVVRTIDDITTKTYTYTAANIATDGFTLSTDIIRFRLYNKSYMKAYDVEYEEWYYYDSSMTLQNRINSVVSTNAELIYDFTDTLGNTTTQWDDLVDSATNTTLVQDIGGVVNKTTLSVLDRGKMVPIIEKGHRFSTTSTTAGASGTNFSMILLVEANTTVNCTYKFLTRTLSGTYGSHSYGLNVGSQGEYSIVGDTVTGYTDISAGQPVMLAITNTATQYERLYLNGVKLDENNAITFVSSWGNDFRFGDNDQNANWAAGGELALYLFAYWNNKVLTDTEVLELYNLWKNGGLKV